MPAIGTSTSAVFLLYVWLFRYRADVFQMGALHEGHLSLVKTSLKRHPFTVMTLFVNPMQFAPHEDLSAYPRTFERDMDSLRSLLPTGPESPIHGLGISEYDGRPSPRSQRQPTDSPLVVFAPTADVMYPLRGELQDMSRRKGASIEVRGWGEVMEGASRRECCRKMAGSHLGYVLTFRASPVLHRRRDGRDQAVQRRRARPRVLWTEGHPAGFAAEDQ